jgi:hypothetical protein
MKRIRYVCFAATLLVVLLFGCDRATTPDEWKDLKYVTDNYSLEDAKHDGYVIEEGGSVTYGKDIWQDFVDLSAEKTPCKVRVVHCYKSGEMYIQELVYNGETFRLSEYEKETLYQSEYKYLMRYEGEAETKYATYTSYVRYVLVNDDKVTWKDITRGIISSQSGNYIPHRTIYTDLAYKEEYK